MKINLVFGEFVSSDDDSCTFEHIGGIALDEGVRLPVTTTVVVNGTTYVNSGHQPSYVERDGGEIEAMYYFIEGIPVDMTARFVPYVVPEGVTPKKLDVATGTFTDIVD